MVSSPLIQRRMQLFFCRFVTNLADSLLLKLPPPKSKFIIKTTREYYKEIRNKCEDFVFFT